MTNSNTPNLTNIVEKKFLEMIDNEEVAAFDSDGILSPESYLKLANLYHFQKDFKKEEEILIRYAESPRNNSEELADIYERIESISQKRHIVDKAPPPKIIEKSSLELTAIESEQEVVELSSSKEVKHKNKNTQTAINGLTIRVLTVCAIYTGRNVTDEIAELSLVLMEYTENKDVPFSIVKTYTGNRLTSEPLSQRLRMKFNLDPEDATKTPIDKETILDMFLQANYVISHNHADIERRHLVTLFPVLKNSKWYSTQKDIPWKALGFESTSLSSIVKSFGRRKPRTSVERAKAICHLLQHRESSTNDPLIERIHYMKPMKEITISAEMTLQHKKMSKQQSKSPTILIVIFIVGLAGLAATKYLGYW